MWFTKKVKLCEHNTYSKGGFSIYHETSEATDDTPIDFQTPIETDPGWVGGTTNNKVKDKQTRTQDASRHSSADKLKGRDA